MSVRHAAVTEKAPAAAGPYGQAIAHAGLLHCSGALPIGPASGELENGSAARERRQRLENLESVCRAAGTTLRSAVEATVCANSLEDDFASINEAYASFSPAQRRQREQRSE